MSERPEPRRKRRGDVNYKVPDGVLRAELEGEEVMLNSATGVYHLLNKTGRFVIDSLQRGRSLDEAVDEIVARSGTSHAQVMEDARSFVAAMLERGLIEEAPSR